MRKTGLFIVALLCWPSVAAGVPVITETCDNYTVRGTTIHELSRQGLHAMKMRLHGGKHVVGLTKSEVDWRYSMQPSEHGCTLQNATVKVNIIISLPYWDERDRAKASTDTLIAWDNYMKALKLHEKGHKDITIASAQALERQLLGIGRQKDCDTVSATAKSIGKRVMKDHEAAQEAYDKETGHGETQGVRLH